MLSNYSYAALIQFLLKGKIKSKSVSKMVAQVSFS